jgi:hypothetical protein
MTQLTLGAANSTPRLGPLLISEIMYNPQVPPQVVDGDSLEYLEIYNPTAENVSLDDWRLAGGIDFDFPLGSMIAAQSAMVITPFDPQDPTQAETLAAFLDHYGLDAGAPLIGGYSGKLDNGGERVRLQRPDEPPIDDPTFIPRLLEDEADYDDDAPWPTIADGGGPALTRLFPLGWGGDVLSWGADTPSPGAIGSGLRVVGIDVNGGNADPADLPGAEQPTSWRDQRSDIRSIVINFNDRVVVSAADLRLTNLGVDAPADADVEIDLTDDHLSVQGSVLTLRFDAQELPEGVYQLEILPSVTNLQGDILDGDADGSPGGTFALVGSSDNRFYKFHGDFNADLGVTIFDFPSFAYWFGVEVPRAPAYVDLNTDGGITIFDFPVFAAGFGKNVTMPHDLVAALPPGSIDVGTPLADAASDDTPRGDEQSALERVVAEWDNLHVRARPLPDDADPDGDPDGDRQDEEREADLLEALVADVARHWHAAHVGQSLRD